jgi:predicted dehydrogenase
MVEGVLKVAVIGCGYWGPNLIRNFSNASETDLHAVCDLDEKKLKSVKITYPNVRITNNYLDILNDPQVDVVSVAVPTAHHYRIVKESLLNGKHVLVEKPMTSTVEEARELVELARQKNLVLMVDHTFEYSGAIEKMKEIIESGELGDIHYIRAEWLNLGLLQPDVNVVWDLAPHIISIISYITNLKPVRLNANAEGYKRKSIPEIAQVHIKFENNVAAYLQLGWLEPTKTRKLTIIGSQKMLVYDLLGGDEQIKVYDKRAEFTEPFNVLYKTGGIYSPKVSNAEPLGELCRHLADCIQNNAKPKSSGESGLRVMKVLEAINASLKNNGNEVLLEDD